MLGLDALKNLAKAKIASADNAIEKAQEEAGPIATDISHGMEEPMGELMEMVLGDVCSITLRAGSCSMSEPAGWQKKCSTWTPQDDAFAWA